MVRNFRACELLGRFTLPSVTKQKRFDLAVVSCLASPDSSNNVLLGHVEIFSTHVLMEPRN